MEKSSSTFSSREVPSSSAIPWAGLVAAVCVLFNELLLFPLVLPWLIPYMGSRDLPMWQAKARWIEEVEVAPQIVILGDSKLLGGLDARMLSEETGISAYNLALGGMQAPGQYFALKRLLERGKIPRAVFYSPSPYLYNSALGGEFSQRFVRWFLTMSEFSELLPDLLSLGGEGVAPVREFMLRSLLPSFSYRYEIRTLLRSTFTGSSSREAQYWLEITQSLKERNGFRVWRELDTGRVDFLGREVEDEYVRNPRSSRLFVFEPHRLNVLYAEKLFELCRHHGIPLILGVGPIPHSLQKKRVEIGYQHSFATFIDGLLASSPNATVQGPLPIVFDDALFLDSSHLSTEGAHRYTKLVSEWLSTEWPLDTRG